MRFFCRLIGHRWSFPMPYHGTLVRTCGRCVRAQRMDIIGRWHWL